MRIGFSELKVGDRGKVTGFDRGNAAHRQKLLSMGLTPGAQFTVVRVAPLGDPVEIRVRGADLSLRSDEASALMVERIDAPATPEPENAVTIAIVGNPNCGKTTLFNGLTGAHQRVGNWGGVTVEKKVGAFDFAGRSYRVVDLPGIYSLDAHDEASAVDESIARDYILSGEADVVINIIDASNLEHGLYLTTQLLEMAAPVAVVLNVMDDLDEREARIDAEAVRRRLDRPVAAVVVTRRKQLDGLEAEIERWVRERTPSRFSLDYPPAIENAIAELAREIGATQSSGLDPRWLALRLLEGDGFAASKVAPQVRETQARLVEKIESETQSDPDTLIADARYRFAHGLAEEALAARPSTRVAASDLIDRIVLNRFLGIPIFLAVMYCLFWFTIALGRAFRPFFVMMSETFFVEGPRYLLGEIGSPKWLTAILADGLGNGLLQVVTFIPIIGFLYLFVSMLEESGYMSRANFVMDRLMKSLGLPGNAFIPMVVGFGCNVPAIMATRTMERPRDRIVAVLMSPFMSCGGRLAVYTVFAAAFFPAQGQLVVFGIYLLGILFAMLTSLLMKFSLLPEERSLHVLTLPSYHWPKPRNVLINSWIRLKMFLFKVGKYIIPLVFLVKILSAWGTDGSFDRRPIEQSMLAAGGRAITPILAPMGVTQDNWPATVALLTGVLHKVVIVSTLGSIYLEQAQHAPSASPERHEDAPVAAHAAAANASPPEAKAIEAETPSPESRSAEPQQREAELDNALDEAEAKARITAFWRGAATAQAFAAAVAEAKWSLARDDRRALFLIDPLGGAHPLAGGVEGVGAKATRRRMARLDSAVLPSVSEAQERARAAIAAERARAAAERAAAAPPAPAHAAEPKHEAMEHMPPPTAEQAHERQRRRGAAAPSADAHLTAPVAGGGFDLRERLYRAAMTVPRNLAALVGIGAPVRLHGAAAGLAPALATRFDGKVGALAYLVLLLCYPCISTTAATARETSRRWTGFMVFWTLSLGYGAAVLFYQIGTFASHPSSSAAWIIGVLAYFILLGAASFYVGPRSKTVPANAGVEV
ncbi:ferrous iron transport protein B [Methylosinus sp. RM1]|uniref:ferrous iron transport protein B n=1 Tax=Methylosinus sp. RM1 TaxID=2583817 RepID=UPI00140E3C87|nr:ferrous iron transport protein B [Methylosinus sp. RM1]